MKKRHLTQHLHDKGCSRFRQGRRHEWRRNDLTGEHSAVPRHREIPNHLAEKICRDLGVAGFKLP